MQLQDNSGMLVTADKTHTVYSMANRYNVRYLELKNAFYTYME